jgi:putative flippase GtrA
VVPPAEARGYPRLVPTSAPPSRATRATELGPKAIRYSAVSVVAVAVTQIVLLLCHGILGWSAALSNVVAVTVGTIPSYTLNRYWVWGKRGRNHWVKEVLPFWAVGIVGLVFSTVLVTLADRWIGSALAVSAANLTAFGILWILKFLLLDHLLFGTGRGETRVA